MKLRPLCRLSQFASTVIGRRPRQFALGLFITLGTAKQGNAGVIWDGGGANTNIDTPANWDSDSTPILTDVAGTPLTFGTGGGTATINVDTAAQGIIINREGNVTLANGAGKLTIGSSGILVSPGSNVRLHSITESIVLDSNQTWTVGPTSGSNYGTTLTVTGAISDAGFARSLSLDGGAKLTLGVTNTYTGGTSILNGTLTLNHGTDTLSDTGAVGVFGGFLNIGSRNDTVGAVLLSNGEINGTTGMLTGSDYDVRAGAISAKLGGTGALTKSGLLTVTLSGENSYSGGTFVNQGKLSLGASNALNNSGPVVVNGDSSEFAFGGNSDTVGAVTLSNGAIISGSSGILSGSSYDVRDGSVSGILGGTGALTKSTAGSVTLSSDSTYTGNTVVQAGTLLLEGSFNNSPVITVGDVGSSGAVLDVTAKSGLFEILGGQTLKGIGTINGDLTVSGTHAPGNSSGVQTVTGKADYLSGSIFDWELSRNTVDQGLGTVGSPYVYDQVLVGGAMTVADTAVLNIVLKTSTDSNSAVSDVLFSDGFWDQPRQWPVFVGATSYNGLFTLSVSVDSGDQPYTSAAPPTMWPSGGFSYSGGNVYWNPVPEPTGLVAGLLLGAGLLRRRR